jgi:predicted metal-dependent hydrolase
MIRSRKRRKTVTITVDREHGVRVAVPQQATAKEAQQIVLRRAGWIAGRLAQLPALEDRLLESGSLLPLLGDSFPLEVTDSGARRAHVTFDGQTVRASVPRGIDAEQQREIVERALTAWYRGQAVRFLTARTRVWAERGGYEPGAILVRNQRRRWGSCSSDGTLRFNWRLMMAEPELVDYVVVHELAHLRVPNHSSTFWAEVGRWLPDYRDRRARLTRAGPSLSL